jgi:hypothetical protein
MATIISRSTLGAPCRIDEAGSARQSKMTVALSYIQNLPQWPMKAQGCEGWVGSAPKGS